MSKLILILGIILNVTAVIFLLTGLADAEGNPITSLIESVACNSPEKLVVESTYYSMPNGESGTNMTYFCEIEPGQRRSVTDSAVLVLGGGFVIQLGLGILFTIVGATAVARNKSKKMLVNMDDYFSRYPQAQGPTATMGVSGHNLSGQETVIDLRGNQANIPPQAQQILNSVLGSVASSVTQAQGGNSLSARLKQLEDAYENDLITKEEYDKVRQAILDSMDD